MFYYPHEIPESADPVGSKRYECVIAHEKIFSLNHQTFFYDKIEDNQLFIVEEHDPSYTGYEVAVFEGIVLKETNGDYSWWKRGKIT